MKLGDKIKQIRTLKGISQKDFATKLKMPISTLANYENNHREPKLEILTQIANVLNVDLWEIIDQNTNLEIDIPEKKVDQYKEKMNKVFLNIEKEKAIREWVRTTNVYQILNNVLEKNHELNDLRNNLDAFSDLEANEFKKLNNIPIGNHQLEAIVVKNNCRSNYEKNILTKIMMILELEKNNLNLAIKNKKK